MNTIIIFGLGAVIGVTAWELFLMWLKNNNK